jgi:hypothetical protein
MKIYCLLLLLFSGTFVFAQKKTKPDDTTHHVTIVYDFFSTDPLKIMRWAKHGKLKRFDSADVRKLYFGDKINFRVKVNPFLYDVKVNGVNIFDGSGLDTAYVSTLLAFFNSGASTSQKSSAKPPDVKAAEESKNDSSIAEKSPTDKQLINLVAKGLSPNVSASEKLKPKDTKKLIQEKKMADMAAYNLLRSSLNTLETEIDSVLSEYQNEKTMLENVLLLSLADYKPFDSIIAEANRYIAYMQNDASARPFNVDSLKQSTDFVLRYWQNSVARYARSMKSTFAQMAKLNEDYSFSTFEDDSLVFHYYKGVADSASKENVGLFSKAYMSFLQNLNNKSLFDKMYNPKFATADSFRFQVELHPSARAKEFIKLYKLAIRDTTFEPYTLPVKRFLKLNLSVGMAFMFGGAVPSSYYFSTPKDQLADDDTVYIRKGRPKAAVIPRIALYTHLYWTNGNWIKPAFTIGISTNPADPSETAYLGGASLILGQSRRMVITLGAALSNTDVLKSRYTVDEPRKKKFYSSVEEAGLTEKKLRFGGFFGVSYNF